jgi:hypothetical protein
MGGVLLGRCGSTDPAVFPGPVGLMSAVGRVAQGDKPDGAAGGWRSAKGGSRRHAPFQSPARAAPGG